MWIALIISEHFWNSSSGAIRCIMGPDSWLVLPQCWLSEELPRPPMQRNISRITFPFVVRCSVNFFIGYIFGPFSYLVIIVPLLCENFETRVFSNLKFMPICESRFRSIWFSSINRPKQLDVFFSMCVLLFF